MRISGDELAASLVGMGAQRGPLYLRLATGVIELIDRGELAAGCLLPSERELAAAARLSRTTVVAGYHYLQQLGRIERRKGSGTRVTAAPQGSGLDLVPASRATPGRASRYLFGPPSTIDLATATLPGLDLVTEEAASIPAELYRDLVSRHHAYDARGLVELRRALADLHTSQGIPTTEAEILITSGAQQAIEIVTTGCLEPGDPVLLEDPAYRGALEAFARAGCEVGAVPCDTDGMIVDELERAVRARPARMIYVQSQVQNPTGAHLSPARRRRLGELAAESSAIVVDDMSLADTTFTELATSPPTRHGPATIMIGSMNKLFWSGLRLGWIRADADVIGRLAQMKGLPDFGTSMLSQQLGVRLLRRIDEAREWRRRDLQRCYDIATDLLGRELPSWRWWQPQGGPSMWVELPEGNSSQFATTAMRFGVAVLPALAFSARGTVNRHLRLPFALPEDRLIPGIERLAQAWEMYRHHGPIDLPLHSIST